MAAAWRAKAVAALALLMSVAVVYLIASDEHGTSMLTSIHTRETGGLSQLKLQLKARERVQKEVEKYAEKSEGADDEKQGARHTSDSSIKAQLDALQEKFQKRVKEAEKEEAARIDQLKTKFEHEEEKVKSSTAQKFHELEKEEKEQEKALQETNQEAKLKAQLKSVKAMEQAKTLQLEKKLNAIRHLENKFSDSKQQQVKPAQQALAPSHDKKDRHQEKEEKQGEEKQVRKSQRKEEAEGQEQIKHKAQHATAAKSHPLTRFERLVQWAEAHGLPKKLADNPADKDKVRRIIARMKADEVVEQMKHKFSHYEKMVSNVVKTAEDDSAMN
ncbi:hypothetical protein GUITHDRAFT_162366 [Guillardia theta CCMP2712]|uniref:Uncharacterized protein n=1 Tax=Guillardia theta (strain CCMP2712) TaxID=905079 RepID=L1JIV2_GUITC|nr:hypothetical protein GUITHDRAFT_162366 [Guillardia theta CCMP2712]EKX48448.1 hypothetical protein GUITHDRAFT_162366 [Guillardia theta CCMP2712]|eukprot:XP_005835428.1 hypothetical protein GUITHDRAFT_162366 [Guillardia theta CCMP2712]